MTGSLTVHATCDLPYMFDLNSDVFCVQRDVSLIMQLEVMAMPNCYEFPNIYFQILCSFYPRPVIKDYKLAVVGGPDFK